VLRYFGDPDAMQHCGDCDNCSSPTLSPAAPAPGFLRRLLGR
jgi:hypothetical protein